MGESLLINRPTSEEEGLSEEAIREEPTAAALYCATKPVGRRSERSQSTFLETIVGRNSGLRSILSQVEAVANTNATVLMVTTRDCDEWTAVDRGADHPNHEKAACALKFDGCGRGNILWPDLSGARITRR
jgi:hypothetical protein